jgi:hypothetical protein
MDVILVKIPGIARNNKLRIIELLEADLNQVLRVAFAINLTKLAQNHKGVISDHHYGLSHRTCILPILNKILTIQILIQKRTKVIVFDNDAKGCYQRISRGISLASTRRIGYSKNSVRMLGKLWEKLEHHISTVYGISEATPSSPEDNLLYGIGQGSCSLKILWALLNQLIMTALGEKFECINLVSVDNSKTSTSPEDLFIDDTTTGVTSDDITSEPVSLDEKDLSVDETELIEQMQVAIQFFLDLLQVTGGVFLERNACDTLSRTGEKRCTKITSKNSESSGDRNYIQCNRTNNRNQEKGSE